MAEFKEQILDDMKHMFDSPGQSPAGVLPQLLTNELLDDIITNVSVYVQQRRIFC